jgi:hypothetical protein
LFEIVGHTQIKVFTLKQVEAVLPLIHRVTEDYSKEVKYLMGCVEAMPNKTSSRCLEIQDQMNDLIQKWQNKIERLGGKPKGLWLADFDFGTGYFCWKYPETQILYCHGYQDGFTGRRLIDNNVVDKIETKPENNPHENSPSPN